MATVTKTIGSGKDHATIALWEANVGNFGSDIYEGVISTNDNFNEINTLTGGTGSPSITTYLHLTTAVANRHAGIAGTGHGRIYNTNAGHVLQLDSAFCRLSWLDIQQDNSGDSDEGVRAKSGANDCLISYCIVWSDTSTANQDGIYTANWVVTNMRVDNCVVYGFDRADLHVQQWHTTSRVVNWDIDHCSLLDSELGCLRVESDGNSDNIDVDVFNTWGADCPTSPFSDGDNLTPGSTPDGSVTWVGSDNAVADPGDLDELQGTNSMTSTELCTSGIAVVTKSSGSWIVVKNITPGSIDLEPLDNAAGNKLTSGVNRQGSEPDARQDFSTAINGARATDDVFIGAFVLAGGTTFTETIAVASTMTAALTKSFLRQITLAVASTMTAALTRVTTWARTLAVASTMTAALTRVTTWARTLAVASTMTAGLTRTADLFRTLAVASTMTAELVRSAIFPQVLAVASTMTAALSRAVTFLQALAVSSTMTAALATLKISAVVVSKRWRHSLASIRHFFHSGH